MNDKTSAGSSKERSLPQRIATRVVQGVCELPDYNSPDGQPDLVMCTVQQLEHCVLQAFEQLEYDREMERGPPDETNEVLERENKAASDFIRGCIEALGIEQPPEGFTVALDALLLQVIGEIESLKGEIVERDELKASEPRGPVLTRVCPGCNTVHSGPLCPTENGNPQA